MGYVSSREDETGEKRQKEIHHFSPSTTASGGRDWISVAEIGGAKSGKPSVSVAWGVCKEEGGEVGSEGGRTLVGREGGRTDLCNFWLRPWRLHVSFEAGQRSRVAAPWCWY